MSYLSVALLIALAFVQANAYTQCSDLDFCTNIRNKPGEPKFRLIEETIAQSETTLTAELTDDTTGRSFQFTATALAGGTFRFQVDSADSPRRPATDALDGEPVKAPMRLERKESRVILTNGDSTADISSYPFTITVSTEKVTVVINGNQRMEYNTENGDESFAVDINFPGAWRAYGIPERGERFALKNSKPGDREPYRMYNFDYPGYATETTDPLYGTVPVLYAHQLDHTSGVFWLTSGQTFVDINNENDQVDTLWISETGAFDLFVFVGPTLQDSVRQYTTLTGTQPLPQLFVLGYHQSRWSYLTQEDFTSVWTNLDANDFPMDVMWLDIDYTEGKKYFTWNYTAFPDPMSMQTDLAADGRKLVLIIDPHIKVEDGYFVYDQLLENKYYIKDVDGVSPWEGECWPGLSIWVDYSDPAARDWFGNLYQFENFPNTTEIVHIWNDMNEPAVFNAGEHDGTVIPDAVHHEGWLHKHVHNMYGFYHTMATYNGLLIRSPNQRPFILTRSHFAGSQRYTGVWTGDNVASWEHLRISIPMCMAAGLSGFSICGADVGGFLDNPDDELIQRWYQLGAWIPFFREHNAEGTIRREPYLYPPEIQERFRTAIKTRYAHLPYWYTLFYEHQRFKDPVMRPTTFHYYDDVNVLDTDYQFLVGRDILVAAVLWQDAQDISLYLPGGDTEYWYEIDGTFRTGVGYITIPVTLDSNPVFYRGGSIIPRKDISRKSSAQMKDDPYTLYVFLNSTGAAKGNLYVDDYESFNYRNKEYHYIEYSWMDGELYGRNIDPDASFDQAIVISKVLLYEPTLLRNQYTKAEVTDDEGVTRTVELSYDANGIASASDLNIKGHKHFRVKFM